MINHSWPAKLPAILLSLLLHNSTFDSRDPLYNNIGDLLQQGLQSGQVALNPCSLWGVNLHSIITIHPVTTQALFDTASLVLPCQYPCVLECMLLSNH